MKLEDVHKKATVGSVAGYRRFYDSQNVPSFTDSSKHNVSFMLLNMLY